VSSTCFEHPSIHPQEDLYMQFYGISFMHPYMHMFRTSKYSSSGRFVHAVLWYFFHASIYAVWSHKAACTSLPKDEHLVVRNMSKTILLN